MALIHKDYFDDETMYMHRHSPDNRYKVQAGDKGKTLCVIFWCSCWRCEVYRRVHRIRKPPSGVIGFQ